MCLVRSFAWLTKKGGEPKMSRKGDADEAGREEDK